MKKGFDFRKETSRKSVKRGGGGGGGGTGPYCGER